MPSRTSRPKEGSIADMCLRDTIVQTRLEEIKTAAKGGNIHVSDFPANDVTALDDSQVRIQFVDLVMAGGGMLGIAHVGYIYAMEAAGIRFRAIAGTSAGAIATILVGAIRENPLGVCGLDLLKDLSDMPADKFVDPPKEVKPLVRLVELIMEGTQPHRLGSLVRNILLKPWRILGLFNTFKGAVTRAIKDAGVCNGDAFESWMDGVLREHLQTNGAEPTMGMIKMRCNMQGLNLSGPRPAARGVETNKNAELQALAAERGAKVEGLVVVVAADITTQTKANLTWARRGTDPDTGRELKPRTQAELYFLNPDDVNPAKLARMSMSVPIFFKPVTVGNLPEGEEKWKAIGYTKSIPKKATFVDGGLLSNFPIQLFHVEPGRPVVMPTFGVLLDEQRKELDVKDMVALLNGLWTTSTKYMDVQFLTQNPDYNRLVSIVKMPDGVNWLDFNMTADKKVALFRAGVQAARDFLLGPDGQGPGFDWEEYKNFRTRLAELQRNA